MQFHSHAVSETEAWAKRLSLFAKPGFVILLVGELGAGKSTFARAFIKALGKDNSEFDVPSPSFSLIQTYDNTRVAVAHVDLFRLPENEDTSELGLSELVNDYLLLIEWPRPAQHDLSTHILHLNIKGPGQGRVIDIQASGGWLSALKRDGEIEAFLTFAKTDVKTRLFFEGDASSRRYEKLRRGAESLILMDMPQRPDGPAVKNGKPYSAIAHLAEGLRSVVAVNDQLLAMGYGAPKIYDCNIANGLALIEDLGTKVFGQMMNAGENMQEPMAVTVEVLAAMAARIWPHSVPVRGGQPYQLSHYDLEAQLIEVDLLPTWFHRHVFGKPAAESLNQTFADLWRAVLPQAVAENPVWVLRDFHSPNLLWLPERQGLKRVGLIDTQDAVLGHPAYDLASMLQDARVDISFDFADRLYAHYVSLRKAAGSFDEAGFAKVYAILGAQRASKILGIFARLNLRDGKPQYLKHMPRVSRYLARNLQHPVLAGLKRWYETDMPAALEIGKP